MSDDTLPELPGMQGASSKQFIIRNSWALSDELLRLSVEAQQYVDLVIESPGTPEISVRYTPEHRDQFTQDVGDQGLFHIWGGECFQIDPDNGQQISRAYSCNGYVQSDISRPVDIGRITVNTPCP